MINYLLSNPLFFAIWAVALVVAVTIHEFAHAFMADRLGDPTPKINGRVTLNPLAHLDPIGTLAILIANIGWGKPVPYDPYNLANPKRDSLLISLAGPASNFILASLLALLLRFSPVLTMIVLPMIMINVGLGVFNLLPIPPLDGSKILSGLLPGMKSVEWDDFSQRYGLYLLIGLLLPLVGGQSIASLIISPIINFLINLLVG
ncbi:site-2 protease family protein [Candidatus Beckwithbacteria bacterium]|nr:site-2 protease family protein [Candidatus Beckwithbacteria bacterium]